ncbi:MAG: Hsp70 family protein [Syntrophobacteraceae bacterium]|nr:Hsp70 family protein [Syntrophobacteraceae bacterium]
MKPLVCGIDLGTTNSVIAYLRDGIPTAIQVEEGAAVLPSVVSFDPETGYRWVGRQARNRRAAFPRDTVTSIKRLMGKDMSVSAGGRSFSPEQISSYILRHLVEQASEVLGAPIEKAVITVPAYFDDAQRRATIRAGELAGLEVLRIVNEPTAAALVYDHISSSTESPSPYILVYDLGGGTFDVSILEIKGEIKEVLASTGDTALGGDDFDERLKDYLMQELRHQALKEDLVEETALKVRLLDIAERTKIALSDHPFTMIHEVAVAKVGRQPLSLDLEISRLQFQLLTEDLIQRTMVKVQEVLEEAHLKAEDIGKLVLVGGATRMPAVQEALAELFDQPVGHCVDPDLCVALGAAIQGGLITGDFVGQILLDVTAHSLGTKTLDVVNPKTGEPDYFSTIIRRNTRIPTCRAEVYRTVSDDQPGVEVEVFQGESVSCAENTLVGSFYYPLKPAPAFSPVVVEFAYDRDGLVRVCVDQKGFENRKEVTLDIRNRKVSDVPVTESDTSPVNYIAEKARRFGADKRLEGSLRGKIREMVGDYESAIRSGAEDARVDELEEQLLELMEQAEEELESGE